MLSRYGSCTQSSTPSDSKKLPLSTSICQLAKPLDMCRVIVSLVIVYLPFRTKLVTGGGVLVEWHEVHAGKGAGIGQN